MNRPRGGLRRSAFCASHLFNNADTTAATTTPAAIGMAFPAMLVDRALEFVSIKLTATPRGRCTTARASEDVALRDNGEFNHSFRCLVDEDNLEAGAIFWSPLGKCPSRT